MLAAAISASAATATLSLGDEVTVMKGETVDVEVVLQTDFVSDAFQLDVDLPAGLTFVMNGTKAAVTKGAATASGMTFSYRMRNSDASIRVIAYLSEEDFEMPGITETDGAVLFSFQVIAAEEGTFDISLSNITVTDCTNRLSKVSVKPAGPFTKTITVNAPVYYLAGDAAIMPVEDAADLEIDENGLTFTEIDHLLAGTYNYSVTIGNAEDATVYATGEPLVIESNGMYTIVYTFDETDKTITAVATRVADATAIDELDAATAEKLLIDGQVIIRRNGIDYTVTGQKL